MMRKLLAQTASILALLVVGVVSVKADSVTLINGGPSAVATYTATGFPGSRGTAVFTLSGNVLTVGLSNTSSDLMTSVTGWGADTTPDIFVNSFTGTGVTAGWTLNQGALGVFEVSANGQGQNEAIHAGGSATLTFVLSSSPSLLTIDLTKLHLQSLPDGSSQKPEGCFNCNPPPPPPPPGVPEPATMILLGTGLVGVAGAARRRHRAA